MTARAGIVPPCNVAGLGKYAAWAAEAEKKLYIFNLAFIYHIQEIIFGICIKTYVETSGRYAPTCVFHLAF